MAVASLRKAAVFLASLPNQQAATLLAALLPEQAAAISAELASMTPPDPEEQEAVIQEFAASQDSDSNIETARAEPVPSETSINDRCEPNVSPFEFLYGLEPPDLLGLVGEEHPQTIALVLSQLPAEQAASALAAFSPECQASVVARIARLDPPNAEIVGEVAASIRRRLAGPTNSLISRGMVRLVKMFGAMRPATERKLLDGLAKSDPDLLHAIRCAMFGPDVAAFAESQIAAAC